MIWNENEMKMPKCHKLLSPPPQKKMYLELAFSLMFVLQP